MRRILLICPFLIIFRAADTLNGLQYTPLYGIHTDYGLTMHYPDFESFVQSVSDKGYSAIMYMITVAYADTLNGYADYRFVSPTLAGLNWTFVQDELESLVQAANNHNMDLYVDLQGLSYVALEPENYPLVSPPTANDVANVVYELAGYGVAGVTEEMALSQWFEPVYEACENTGLTYIHKAIAWDFGAYAFNWNTTVFETYPYCHVIMTEDYDMTMYPPLMPAYTHFPAIASLLNEEYNIKMMATGSVTNMENMILLKATQFKPPYIYFMTWNTDHIDSFDLDSMTSLIQEYVSDEQKPICNVVIHLSENEGPDVWDWWQIPAELAPITNGILASGYAITTTRSPVPDADMYYIFTRGKWEWGTTLDLSDSIVQLFDSGKPVILHLSHMLPNNTQHWNMVRQKLGIDTTTFDMIENADTTLFGIYDGIQYPHLLGSNPARISFINNITPANLTGEVLSTGNLSDTTYVLITRNGNNYFVNGMG